MKRFNCIDAFRKTCSCVGLGVALFIGVFLQVKPAWGIERFQTTTDTFYKIYDDGSGTVTQSITTKNLTSVFAIETYNLSVPWPEISEVRARYNGRSLTASVSAQNIAVDLGKIVVKQDESYSWTLSFKAARIAKKVGRLWEIKLPNPPLDFSLPKSFGKETYRQETDRGLFLIYNPNNDSAPYQLYDFNLTYELKNTNFYPNFYKIGLPADDATKQFKLSQKYPTAYWLWPGQTKTVIISGTMTYFIDSNKPLERFTDNFKPRV